MTAHQEPQWHHDLRKSHVAREGLAHPLALWGVYLHRKAMACAL